MSHIPASAMPHAKPHEEPEEQTTGAVPASQATVEPETQADSAPTGIGPEDIVPIAASEPGSPKAEPASGLVKSRSGSMAAIVAVGVLAVGGIVAALTLRGSDAPHKGGKRKPKPKHRQGKAVDAD